MRTIRQLADAVWKEIRTVAPARSRREKGGFAAIVDSANLAGRLNGTRKMGNHCQYARRTRELLRRTWKYSQCTRSVNPALRNGQPGPLRGRRTLFLECNGEVGTQKIGHMCIKRVV